MASRLRVALTRWPPKIWKLQDGERNGYNEEHREQLKRRKVISRWNDFLLAEVVQTFFFDKPLGHNPGALEIGALG